MPSCASRPLRIVTGPLLAVLWTASVLWSAPPEKPGNAAAADAAQGQAVNAADLPAGVIDLSDKVEVTVNGGLRSSSRTAHSVAIVLKNISDEDLNGPLVVVVEQTGIAGLELMAGDGELSDGRAYVEVVSEKGKLRAGKSSRPTRLSFKTDEALTQEARAQFELQVRVCRIEEQAKTARSDDEEDDKIPGKSYTQKDFDRVANIQEKWTIPLIERGKGMVYGTAVTENSEGELAVKVYAQRSGVDDLLPDTVEGIPVIVSPIGEVFTAGPAQNDIIYENGRPRKARRGNEDDFKKGAGIEPIPEGAAPQGTAHPLPTLIDPTVRFNRPVPVGVSISNADRLLDIPERALCYSGTLGCRCVDALGNQYILTNLHVGGAFSSPDNAAPEFMGGVIGERIVQPSTGDMLNLCTVDPNNVIGTLVDFETIFMVVDDIIPVHLMDACIVQAEPGAVGFAPPPENGYPRLRRDVVNKPYIGMPVQKYGRTTIYTNGTVTALNAATFVNYGALAFFVRQIEAANLVAFGQPFSQGGDSGALVVAYKPGSDIDGQPLGLLFAGGPRGAVDVTIINPLAPILTRFGLQVDDGQGAPFQAGKSGTMGGAIAPTFPPSDVNF